MKLKELLPVLYLQTFQLVERSTNLTDVIVKLDFRKHKREWLEYEVVKIFARNWDLVIWLKKGEKQ